MPTLPRNGLVVFDRIVDATYLAANTGGALTSSYTEADPRPGRVAAVDNQTLVPVISNAQPDDELTVYVQRSGYGGTAGLSYSLASSTARRGWLGVRPIGWEAVQGLWTAADDWSLYSTVAIPSTGELAVAYAEDGVGPVYFRRRAHADESWSSEVVITTNSVHQIALVCLANERLVLVRIGTSDRVATHYSDDRGDTWRVLARTEDIGITLAASPDHIAGAAIGDSQILVFVRPAIGTAVQLGSADGGITWSRVQTGIVAMALQMAMARGPDGSAVLAYFEDLTVDELYVKRFSSAFLEFVSVPPSAVIGTSLDVGANVAVTVDADDAIYVATQLDGVVTIHTSVDSGASWSATDVADLQDGNDTRLINLGLASAAGRTWLFHNNVTAHASVDGSLTALKLASWSSHEWDDYPTVVWLPIEMPDETGWTASGTGTGDLFLAHLRVVVAAAVRHYTWDDTSHSFAGCLHVIASCTSGGGGTSGGFQLTSSAAAQTYTMRVSVFETGFTVTDNIAASTIVTVVGDLTVDTEFLAFANGAGSFRLLWKRPNDVLWTSVSEVTAHSFSNGGALVSNASARIGALSASTGTFFFRYAAYYEDFAGVSSGAGLIGKRLGGAPYPLGDVVDAEGRMAHLSIRGGLALNTEQYAVPPLHTYAIEHAMLAHPSPTEREWRSEDDESEVVISYNLGGRTWLGNAIAVVFQQCNFETAHLEYHDGTGWELLATYSACVDFSGVAFGRTGATIVPIAGITAGARMLQEQELARGGWVRLNDGAGGADFLRAVADNSGGWWSSSAVAPPRVNLAGVTDAEPVSGDAYLCSPGGLLIAYHTSVTASVRQRIRIRIPAQPTVEGYFRAGIALSIGRVIPFAQEWGWGWTQQERAQYESSTSRAGIESRSRTGDEVRSWSFAFSEGVAMAAARQDVTVDAVSVIGGLPMESHGSNLFQLSGILRRTQGQTLPVVAVSRLPAANATITDRTLYLYGQLSNSVASSVAQGREGVNEDVRIETIRVDGYPGG